jgi:hypothetical protein
MKMRKKQYSISFDHSAPGSEELSVRAVVIQLDDGSLKVIRYQEEKKGAFAENKIELPPKIRFNQGYWDGAIIISRGFSQEEQIGTVSPYDPFYEAGLVFAVKTYTRGEKADGDWAWNAFQASNTDPYLIMRIEESK